MKIIFLTFAVSFIFLINIFSQEITNDTKPYDPLKQAGRNYNSFSVGINTGLMLFYGDYSEYEWYPKGDYKKDKGWANGLFIEKTFTPVFGLQANILSGNLKSSMFISDNVIYNFKASVFEYYLSGNVNLSNILNANKTNRRLSIFANLGLGLVDFRTVSRVKSTDAFIASYGYSSEGTVKEKKTTELVLPLGLGVKYQLTKKFDIGINNVIKFVNSDKIDTYVGGNKKDVYNYTNLSLTYHFGKKEKNLQWTTPYELVNADDDKDGVPNIYDIEPNTIAGAKVDGRGVAVDSDGDGIADIDDLEPNTQRGARVNDVGIALDKDKDGVPDGLDKDNNTKNGSLVNFQGISISLETLYSGTDSDSDGVPDSFDKEPNTPKGNKVNFQGQAFSGSLDSLLATVLPSIYFSVNSTKIDERNFERIAPIARLLILNPSFKIEVLGYADLSGNSAYNRELSKRRAEAVLNVLTKTYGISKDRLYINYFGDTRPLSKDKTMNINRRVDFMIIRD